MTEAEELELLELEARAASGRTPSAAAAPASTMSKVGNAASAIAPYALEGAQRVLDYVPGALRTGTRYFPPTVAYSALLGGKPVMEQLKNFPQDAWNTVLGKAPSTEQYLTQLGVPEMQFESKGARLSPEELKQLGLSSAVNTPGKTSLRHVLGMTGDVASGVGGSMATAKIMSGLGNVGKLLHGTAYEVPEARYREIYGKQGPGPKQIAFEQGVDRPQDIMPAMQKAGAERAQAYADVTNAGGAVDVNRAFADAEKKATDLASHRDRTMAAKGQAALDEIKRLKEDYGPKYANPSRVSDFAAPGNEPTVVRRSSQFVPQEPTVSETPTLTQQTTMPSAPQSKPISLITGKPVTTPKHRLPPQELISPQTRSVTYPEQIVSTDPLTGKPTYRMDIKPVNAFTMGEGAQSPPYRIDPKTGLPIKELIETRRTLPAVRPFTPASNLEDFSGLKTALQSQMGDDAWNQFVKTPEGQKLANALGVGARNEILNTAAEVNPEAAARIAEKNKIMESLYAMSEQAPSDILKEARKNKLITPVDAALFMAHPAAEVAKKGADVLKIPTVRTRLGRGIYDFGHAGEAFGNKLVAPTVLSESIGKSVWEKMAQ